MAAPKNQSTPESSPEMMEIAVSFRGKEERVSVRVDAVAGAVVDALVERHPELDPLTVKLIIKGRKVRLDADPVTTCIGKKVIILGTSRAARHDVETRRSDPTLRGLDAERARDEKREAQPVKEDDGQHPEYRFAKISAVSRFAGTDGAPHFYEAERRLRDLAKDVAFLMLRHRWTVGHLLEMDPRDDRYLKKKKAEGDDQGCLLGYNENAGARIYVLLRDPDSGMFRARDDVVQTLLHELCHNAVGPHNAAFFALYAQLRGAFLDREKRKARRTEIFAARAPRTLSMVDASREPEDVVAGELAREAGNAAISPGERASAAAVATFIANNNNNNNAPTGGGGGPGHDAAGALLAENPRAATPTAASQPTPTAATPGPDRAVLAAAAERRLQDRDTTMRPRETPPGGAGK